MSMRASMSMPFITTAHSVPLPGPLPQGVQEVLSRTSEGAYGSAAGRCTACWLTICQHLCCTGASSPGHASSACTADHTSGWRTASGSSCCSRCRDGRDGHDGDLNGRYVTPQLVQQLCLLLLSPVHT